MNFIIAYEDLKKILGVFYASPYSQVAPYVEILHGLKEAEGAMTLIERLKTESENIVK